MKEHKADVRHHKVSYTVVVHIDQDGYLLKWQNTQVIRKGLTKTTREALVSAYIRTENYLNVGSGFVKWSQVAAQVAVGSGK